MSVLRTSPTRPAPLDRDVSSVVFLLQVGVIQYGSTVVHEFTLGEYQTVEEVVEATRSIDQRGGEETRTALGINVARYQHLSNCEDWVIEHQTSNSPSLTKHSPFSHLEGRRRSSEEVDLELRR